MKDSYKKSKSKINLIKINYFHKFLKTFIKIKLNLQNQMKNQNNNKKYQIYPNKLEQ